MAEESSVKVALRVRPQSARERIEMCRICTSIPDPAEPQITIGTDRSFTFDFLFDIIATQDSVYNSCVQPLIQGCFDGKNATVLAYGQTGSGKTYTMGSGFDLPDTSETPIGIIPRAVEQLFQTVGEMKESRFEVGVQFLELYNEEIIDLFDASRDPEAKGKKSRIKIHDDSCGNITLTGITVKTVSTVKETLELLRTGALGRTTASTNMNSSSSRSHAIFTLYLRQERVVNGEGELLTAKFHFVDLAGSERLKRTGATGDRAKEGININCGLLALGNVISALGDTQSHSQPPSHIPYRDSKLTRLLSDSLGGNSQTLMIACVSPSDCDFVETLNTLKYANRARNIRNRVQVNQDKQSQVTAALRLQISRLEAELEAYKQGREPLTPEADDFRSENTLLMAEISSIKVRLKAQQEAIEALRARNVQLLVERDCHAITTDATGEKGDKDEGELVSLVRRYVGEIEDLKAKLCEAESSCEILRRHVNNSRMKVANSPSPMDSASPIRDFLAVPSVMQAAKADIERLKTKLEAKRSTKDETSRLHANGLSASLNDISELPSATDNVSGEEEIEEDLSSSTEDESGEEQLETDLADLQCEINIKQRLVDELEQSQQRLLTLKHQYEEKLRLLQTRIRDTELERDRVLNVLESKEGDKETEKRNVQTEYEKKLSDMKAEMKRFAAAHSEHQKFQRAQSHTDQQLRSLQAELLEMKRVKVQLVQKMKEDTNRAKQADLKRQAELEQSRRDARKNAAMLQKLAAEKRQADVILKRKQEEVAALRKVQRPYSAKVSGKFQNDLKAVDDRMARRTTVLHRFSLKNANHKWLQLEKSIVSLISNKQTVASMEMELERWMQKREENRKQIDQTSDKLLECANESIREELESLQTNGDYIQQNISDCQKCLMELEDAKSGIGADLSRKGPGADLIRQCDNLEELKYLLTHLCAFALTQGTFAARQDTKVFELQANLNQVTNDKIVIDKLMTQIIASGKFILPDNLAEMSASGISESTTSLNGNTTDHSHGVNENQAAREKARRRTATTEELLFPDRLNSNGNNNLAVVVEDEQSNDGPTRNCSPAGSEVDLRTLMPPPPVPLAMAKSLHHSSSTSSMENFKKTAGMKRQASGVNICTTTEVSPVAARRSHLIPLRTNSFTATNGDQTGFSRNQPWRSSFNGHGHNANSNEPTPPPSPSPNLRRKFPENQNVFSRLSSGALPADSLNSNRKIGEIRTYNPTSAALKSLPLKCIRLAEGHSRAVLCLQATDQYLFTGSQDRTAKIWSLTSGQEVRSFGPHTAPVVAVKFCPQWNLLLTASGSHVRLYDLHKSELIQTFNSSGLTGDKEDLNRQSIPVGLQDAPIQQIELSNSGSLVFTAAGNHVRIWDIRKFQSVGKLSTGHMSQVTSLAVLPTLTNVNTVVTGSKDHFVKVFEVPESAGDVFSPRLNLEPPHYDGIASLVGTSDGFLFSASRDSSIKKWDLKEGKQIQMQPNCHRHQLLALSFLPPPIGSEVLVSSCQGGNLRLWNSKSLSSRPLAEIRGHSNYIGAMTTNNTCLFTASGDNTVGIWQPRVDMIESLLESNRMSPS